MEKMRLIDMFCESSCDDADDMSFVDEASPFTSWLKKGIDKLSGKSKKGGEQLGFDFDTKKQKKPKQQEPQKKKSERPSAWSTLSKAFGDPSDDPENTIYIPPNAEKRYDLRRGLPAQVDEPLPALKPMAEPEKNLDQYEREQQLRQEKEKMRYLVIRELDKANGITPEPGKLGHGATIMPSKKRPGFYRAYYPGLEHGYIIVFNPTTGWIGKRWKDREYYNQLRAQHKKIAGSASSNVRPGEVAKATDKEIEDIVSKALGDTKPVAEPSKEPIKEPEKAVPKEKTSSKPEAPSKELASALGSMDPGMQKAIMQQQSAKKERLKEPRDEDMRPGFIRRNGFTADEKFEIARKELDYGTLYIPVNNGVILPGTKYVLLKKPSGLVNWVSTKRLKDKIDPPSTP